MTPRMSIGRQEARQQIVLDLAGDPLLAAAVAVDHEQLPVFARHHREGHASPVPRQRWRVHALGALADDDRRRRGRCRSDKNPGFGWGPRHVDERAAIPGERRRRSLDGSPDAVREREDAEGLGGAEPAATAASGNAHRDDGGGARRVELDQRLLFSPRRQGFRLASRRHRIDLRRLGSRVADEHHRAIHRDRGGGLSQRPRVDLGLVSTSDVAQGHARRGGGRLVEHRKTPRPFRSRCVLERLLLIVQGLARNDLEIDKLRPVR